MLGLLLAVPVRLVDGGTDWAAWTAAVAAVATFVVLLVSAIFALMQLKASEETRYAELVADLSRRWDEPLLSTARRVLTGFDKLDLEDLVMRIWDTRVTPHERRMYYQIQALPNFIETLAVIEYDVSGLSLAIIDALWGTNILGDWERWEPTVRYLRDKANDDEIYANFELLARRIRWHRVTGLVSAW